MANPIWSTRLAPGTPAGSLGWALPADVVGAAAARLRGFMYVVIAADAFYSVLYLTVWRQHGSWFSHSLALAQVTISGGLIWYLRRRALKQSTVTRIGITYEIALCLSFAFGEFYSSPPALVPQDRISWVCVVLVLFPALVPAPPLTMLMGSLTSAAMMPVGYVLALPLTGNPVEKPTVLASLFIPPLLCALISGFVAQVVHRLGTEVVRARRLGSYELVERLAAGGMGEVWSARHRLLARPAAIKLMRPLALGNTSRPAAQVIERFEREAQATSLLTSPHTVELYDYGVSEDGIFYYVMELLDGLDLETLVRECGPVPAERAVWLLRQACDSLDDAHHIGLVHRDIKPANIITSRRGRRADYVKVLDFGLVKNVLAPDVRLTGDLQITGTPAFLAPEAATGEATIDARSDIYGLGCVAYWLVTGRLVFEASTPMNMAIAHASTPPEPASARAPAAIPPELDRLILDCLAKDKAARPQSALELQQRLNAIPLAEPWTETRADAWWRKHVPPAPAPFGRSFDESKASTSFELQAR